MPYMLPLLNMQAPPPPVESKSSSKPQQQMILRTVSISILVMSLPVLYVSFLHVPPAALFRDTTFWFLMSNSIIIVIAADSGMLFFSSSSGSSRSSSSIDDNVDNDGGSLPFAVSGAEPVAVKNGHVITGVSVVADEVTPVENHHQVMGLRQQEEDVTMMVAENDNAYALVLRQNRGEENMAIEPVPEISRDITVVSPPPSSGLAAGEAAVFVENEVAAMVRANRRYARREERLRRRHSHRPSSQSHLRALVPVQDKSVVVMAEEKQLRRSATERRPPAAEEKEKEKEKEIEYSRLTDEELNRRVEEFITKFNMEMRMQMEREQQLALAAA